MAEIYGVKIVCFRWYTILKFPKTVYTGLAHLCHDDRRGHTPLPPSVSQKGAVPGGGEELAVAEAEQVELVNIIVRLSWSSSLTEERPRELQRSLH